MIHKNLDPELAPAVEPMQAIFGEIDKASLTLEDIPVMRKALASALAGMATNGVQNPNIICEERRIPGPEGDPDVRVKIYRPTDQSGTLPCFYHIHGGGLILGGIDEEQLKMELFAEKLNTVVISVDYRLAPEHPFPAPVEDCYAGLKWAAEHASELRIDPDRIVVGGESAGGGLAAATILLARDRNGPKVSFQYLIYPMLDDRNITPSSQQFTGNWPGWSKELNELGWLAYLGDQVGSDNVSPYAAPARANDLSNLPPTYIEVGALENFRDEDIDYAKGLMQADVSVEFHVYPGAFHGFEVANPMAKVSQKALNLRLSALEQALHPNRVKSQT
ncbi:alpha/beta hydrolase [Bacillus sp. B15-48]|uniref:alpha/beta hydrolase n=1 Tax=Bacillus sp. B15-48 TaxID=1548601 RepID=UPI0019401CFE|nr:alpha/beta hydrolase [Bacillus sp. B15-48]MBM4761231.1 alpha/beta hydrolase fold domain-containing protein [Bacillus sp. B15-48]